MEFKVGDRVRHSGYTIQRARDYWNRCGREPMKSGAKAELDRLTAERGTVIEVCTGDMKKAIRNEPGGAAGMTVRTDSGAVHKSLPYLWELES